MINARQGRKSPLSAAEATFIDDLAQVYERYGLSLTFGRLLGLLLLSDDPLSLDDIAERLQISKSGASVAARELQRAGVLRRVTTPGSRRLVYEATDDMEPLFLGILARIRDSLAVIVRADSVLAPGRARRRLHEMKQLHEFWLREGSGIIDRWHQRRPPR